MNLGPGVWAGVLAIVAGSIILMLAVWGMTALLFIVLG